MNPQPETAGALNGVIDTRMDSFEIDLSVLQPIRIPFSLGGNHFVLIEAPSDAVVKWRNAQLNATKIIDGKAAGFNNMADTEPLLVSLCVFKSTGEGSTEVLMGGPQKNIPQGVSLQGVRGWPYRAQKVLFEKIKKISGLEEVNPAKKPLLVALSRPDSPVQLSIFRGFINDLIREDERMYGSLSEIIGTEDDMVNNKVFSPKDHSDSTENTLSLPTG